MHLPITDHGVKRVYRVQRINWAPQKVPKCRDIQGFSQPDVQLDQQHPPPLTHSIGGTLTHTHSRRTGCERHAASPVQPDAASRHRQATGNQTCKLGGTGHRVSVGQCACQDPGTPTTAPLRGRMTYMDLGLGAVIPLGPTRMRVDISAPAPTFDKARLPNERVV